ncbi:MAG: flagellar assembly protein FliX [Pseudomonadota bacterium]
MMIRIDTTRQTTITNSKKTKAAQPSARSGFSSLVASASDEETEATGDAPPTHIGGAGLSGLLALQQDFDTDPDQQRQKRQEQVNWASGIIEEMQAIRLGLLRGRFSLDELEAIQKRVQRKPDFNADPRLQNLLHDIEARAAVEIAKYRHNSHS